MYTTDTTTSIAVTIEAIGIEAKLTDCLGGVSIQRNSLYACRFSRWILSNILGNATLS